MQICCCKVTQMHRHGTKHESLASALPFCLYVYGWMRKRMVRGREKAVGISAWCAGDGRSSSFNGRISCSDDILFVYRKRLGRFCYVFNYIVYLPASFSRRRFQMRVNERTSEQTNEWWMPCCYSCGKGKSVVEGRTLTIIVFVVGSTAFYITMCACLLLTAMVYQENLPRTWYNLLLARRSLVVSSH